MVHEDKYFPVERNATVGGIFLVDPETNRPYKAGITVQQVEGGFDPTGLSTEAKQNAILSAIENLTTAFQDNAIQEVVLTDDQLPPVDGQATATKQEQILTALNALTALAVDDQDFRNSGVRTVTADSLPLPTGASTASKQDQILAELATITQALSGTLEVSGTVGLEANDVTVTGQVAVTNASIPVTAAGTFPATVEGVSTSAKQDAILSALGTLLTAIQAPQPITDNNGSITVDGAVGVSGPVAVTDNNGSLTVDGTVAATQSGAWNVGITGTPTVTVSGPVTIRDSDDGPIGVNGSVALTNASIPVTQSGTWTMQTTPGASATSAALISFRNGAITAAPTAIKTSSGRVYQYTFFNMNNAPVFVHFYDALVANITPGTTVPKMTFALPAGSTLDGYWSISHGFATAITIAASTAWAGSGAPTTPVMVTVGYA